MPLQRARVRAALSAVAIAIALALYSRSSRPLSPPYALCSRDGPRIYTLDDNAPTVQCILVNDTSIAAVGSYSQMKRAWPVIRGHNAPHSLPIRFVKHGAIVTPGFMDCHTHILEYGAQKSLDLSNAVSKEDAISQIRRFIESRPELIDNKHLWIRGWSFDHTKWPGSAWPTSDDFELDPVVKDRNIVIYTKDGHGIWISRRLRDPLGNWPKTVKGGLIIRDTTGKATGVLLDDAMQLVDIPPYEEHELEKQLNLTAQDALSRGITQLTDAAATPVTLELLRNSSRKTRLPLRVYAMRYFDPASKTPIRTLEKIGDSENRLVSRSVKIFVDGALRSSGAALYEPYDDEPGYSGFLKISPSALRKAISEYAKEGWQVNVHCIGDRAVGVTLDALEYAAKSFNLSALRPRLEHAQMMTLADVRRASKLRVIASVQPVHAVSDMWFAEQRVGHDRAKRLYSFKTFEDHGIRLAFGSDIPVETFDPLVALYAAVTRVSPDSGTSPHGTDGWFPNQRLTREAALRGLTIDAAYASFSEDSLGSLSVGKRADFVVLDRDILFVPVKEILQTKVLATFIDGLVVHGKL